jgi:hypothetical protein
MTLEPGDEYLSDSQLEAYNKMRSPIFDDYGIRYNLRLTDKELKALIVMVGYFQVPIHGEDNVHNAYPYLSVKDKVAQALFKPTRTTQFDN